MEKETKICKSCGRELSLDKFALNNKAADGHMSECQECRKCKRSGDKSNPLSKFTPRELMDELFKRGYKGTLQYVEVHKITLGNI